MVVPSVARGVSLRDLSVSMEGEDARFAARDRGFAVFDQRFMECHNGFDLHPGFGLTFFVFAIVVCYVEALTAMSRMPTQGRNDQFACAPKIISS